MVREQSNRRDALWQRLSQTHWDVIVVGGGITGAGVLRAAAQRGLKALLIEQRDFAWGSSSRSSKMVHGGLRYISQGAFRLTRESVQERQRLMQEAPGLVEPMPFVFPFLRGKFPNRFAFNLVMRIYDAFAGKKWHRSLSAKVVKQCFPGIIDQGLYGGTEFTDAITDDARLVMRVLDEAKADGADAINYVKAEQLIKEGGQVVGLDVCDAQKPSQRLALRARAVVNATGAWADALRNQVMPDVRVRPLRGSHLVVSKERLPIAATLSTMNPEDGRAAFICPWEGRVQIGTTDLDHSPSLDNEAGITNDEVDYLLRMANGQFPNANLTRKDVLTTWSGVRPIVAEAGKDVRAIKPSKARRDHSVWVDDGLITVTGGKLTTFRVIAQDVMSKIALQLNQPASTHTDARVFRETNALRAPSLPEAVQRRLLGRFGMHAQTLVDDARDGELTLIDQTHTLWAEVRWSLEHESIQHLDDLLLRRTRLGLLFRDHGAHLFERLKTMLQDTLHWSDEHWQRETKRYLELCQRYYYLPSGDEPSC